MKIKSVSVRTKKAPKDRKRELKLRERLQRDKPTLEELGVTDTVPLVEYVTLKLLAKVLREARGRSKMTLKDIAARAGMDRAYVNKLENGKQVNMTVGTLTRYASALGKEFRFALVDVE